MKFASLIILGVSLPAAADLSWTFDVDAAGWGTLNDATAFTWDGALGNPVGAIRARDVGDGRIWYYAAPAGALGDISNLYGGEISWDILGIQGNQTSIPDRADVMLVGGGYQIGIDVDVVPLNGTWTSWSAGLSSAGGWELVSSVSNGVLNGDSATESQIRAVLGDLQGLYIRGEYTNGSDQTAIDNVLVVPGPGVAAGLGMGAVAARRRRR
ncbi:MAG: hypothetical protein H6810_10270 [Phycisphaeraceae bacterium]|nr:MAG: hypothetical protein H6810_10270 [Phycisphaeraceae bacterium]